MKNSLQSLLDKKLYKDIGFLLTLAGEFVIYRFGFMHSFKKFQERDLVIIRYSDWKPRMSHGREESIGMLVNLDDIHRVEDSALFIRSKYLKCDEELTGMILKKWKTVVAEMPKKHYSSDEKPTYSKMATDIAVFTGDAVYVIREEDWLRGIEVITPSQEMKTSIFRKLRNKLK